MHVYFPGCRIKARYPEASAWMTEQVLARGYADEATGCCRINHQKLTPQDTAVCICNNCMAMIDEDAVNGALENLWMLIDSDPGFPLPHYDGMRVALQDCGRAYDRTDVQDAVRSILAKMGVEVIELPDAREKSHFCGKSFLQAAPAQDLGFAPWRYGEDAAARGVFIPHDADEIQLLLKKHCAGIAENTVACYCVACDIGLEAGGKDAVNLIELVSGKFRA